MTTLRPFFSFYGGKWLISPHYPAPKHRTLIEPFAGSAGYSVRHYERDIMLTDIDPIIAGVWQYLISVKPSEIHLLPSEVQHISDLPSWVPQEAKWLIGFWLNPGSATPKRSMSKWKIFNHSNTGQLYWGDRVKTRLCSQVGYIRHWTVRNCSYSDIQDENATWFIDPPYQNGGEHYRCSKADYEHLGEWCRSRTGQVIVCERDGAKWMEFRPLCTGRSAKYQYSKEAIVSWE